MYPANSDELPARETLPTITEAADMLALLEASPRRRAVAYGHFADRPAMPCVCEYPSELSEGLGRILAVIEAGSADEMLQAAIDATERRDGEAWPACPIRYRPSRTATQWVHPGHEEAPAGLDGPDR